MSGEVEALVRELEHALGPAAGDHGDTEGLADCARRVLAERNAERAERLKLVDGILALRSDDVLTVTIARANGEVAAVELVLARDRDSVKRDYDAACQTIAAMHAAAVGEVRGPSRGVVEDVADLRARCLAAELQAAGVADLVWRLRRVTEILGEEAYAAAGRDPALFRVLEQLTARVRDLARPALGAKTVPRGDPELPSVPDALARVEKLLEAVPGPRERRLELGHAIGQLWTAAYRAGAALPTPQDVAAAPSGP